MKNREGSVADIDLSTYRLDFGKHSGTRVQEVPVSYLRFMLRSETRAWRVAEAELARRNSVVPEIEISGHAVDSASLRIRKRWHEDRGDNEGLHAWLCRVAWAAYQEAKGRVGGGKMPDKIDFQGVRWVFDHDGRWPVLKTVTPLKRKGPPTTSGRRS